MIDQASLLGVDLEVSQARQLLVFEDLLVNRAIPLGLVGPGDAPDIRRRHILDSLRAVPILENTDFDAYDLGSGAGLPGIVIAIARPHLRIGLVEARRRRAAFLELVVERLGLARADVLPTRAERLSDPVDVCFARALSSLERAWKLSGPLLKPEGRLVYFAGGRGALAIEAPPGATFRLVGTPVLESSGPLVIMARR
jgi:16S rRNA (guanine527-N7)-methyltransferase